MRRSSGLSGGSVHHKQSGKLTIPSVVFLLICFLGRPIEAQYSGGTGEPNDPYQIATAEDLVLLGETPEDYDKHFILTADIDLEPNLPGGQVFDRAVIAPDTNDVQPGFQGTAFTGAFDGNGHTISRLTITGGWHLGLFAQLDSGAKISNLGLEAVDVSGTGPHIGGLAGYNLEGSITNCYSTGSVTGDNRVGGLVGSNHGNIANCYSTGMVSGNMLVGGLAGSYHGGSISNCYSAGNVTGDDRVGGLVGSGSQGVLHSVWDMETSGLTGCDVGVGLTTAEMMDPYMLGLNGFASDPNWVLDVGRDYPRLVWQGTPGQIIPEPDIDWLEGEGTQEAPYRIHTADQMILLSRAGTLWDKHLILGADINLDPNLQGRQVFSQAVIQLFSGVFDGNGHVISHLTIAGGRYLGLFGRLGSGAKISNLGLETVDVNGTGAYVGGLAGSGGSWENKAAVLTNCYSTGTVSGEGWCVGGLMGSNMGGITNCYSTGTVNGDYYVGGLVGSNGGSITASYSTGSVSVTGDHSVGGLAGINDGSITNCHSTGSVTGDKGIGGLAGSNGHGQGVYGSITASYSTGSVSGIESVGGLVGSSGTGDIANCHSTGSVSGIERVGGLVGSSGTGDIANCYSTGSVTGQRYVGGLVGENRGSITTSYSTGSVSGIERVGGLLGSNGTGDIANCYSTGLVTGYEYVGGLMGANSGGINMSCSTGTVTGEVRVGGLVGNNTWDASIANSYSTGTVSGWGYVGGLVGDNRSSITASYSTGTVSGNEDVGGLVGIGNPDWVTDCFWDTQTSGQATSAGGTGKTTAEMQVAATFLEPGWDFMDETANGTEDIWWILEGQDYPRLWWELIDDGSEAPAENYLPGLLE